MDYSYLNQAAATFDSQCLQSAMDPSGMPCSYGDLTSCNQMSQAAYRYTAAAATMARSYNPVTGPANPLHHSAAAASAAAQCNVMGARQDVHRTSMFPSSMNLNCECALAFYFNDFFLFLGFCRRRCFLLAMV